VCLALCFHLVACCVHRFFKTLHQLERLFIADLYERIIMRDGPTVQLFCMGVKLGLSH
jgi:hypothetical protein